MYLSTYMFICLYVYLSICLYFYMSIFLYVYLSICLYFYMSIFLYLSIVCITFRSFYFSNYVPFHLFICLFYSVDLEGLKLAGSPCHFLGRSSVQISMKIPKNLMSKHAIYQQLRRQNKG